MIYVQKEKQKPLQLQMSSDLKPWLTDFNYWVV